MLKAEKSKYYGFNLRDGLFVPSGVKDIKLNDKMKQIVVPELKNYYKRLNENKSKI